VGRGIGHFVCTGDTITFDGSVVFGGIGITSGLDNCLWWLQHWL